ncbi:MAG: 30S ribosomal protein S12 methylthiotransferase RimO [bacterium]
MIKGRVDIISLGCYKNLVDSEQLMARFKSCGYDVQHDSHDVKGEIVVVNTCGFIGDAKEESIEMILQLAEAKLEGKISKLFVMGCLSERYLSDLKIEIPEVDAFYGKFNWSQLISDLGHNVDDSALEDRVLTTPSHYAYVKIAEGCNRTCSYCAIPIITGKHKSRTIESIEKEVEALAKSGVKEFQLIAQDLTFYGIDLYKKNTLPQLVDRLAKIEGVQWLRLHYAYPAHFPFELLTVMRENDNVCAYLDIALQHISDNMLTAMRRNVSKADTYELIKRMRAEVPNIHIRTTLLVGHPNETDADFEELKQFVKDIEFDRMGVFPYSNEEGTYAYLHYDDNVPEEVKRQRVDELMQLQQGVSERLNSRKVGQVMKVIVDREEADYYVARTEFDSPEVDGEVYINKNEVLQIGDFYDVKITDADLYDLYAEVV